MVNAKILIRRDTAARWTTSNPILGDGEQGYETDTKKMKIGNGTSTWTQLPYFLPSSSTFFQGGVPSTVFTSGPVFDMGGVN